MTYPYIPSFSESVTKNSHTVHSESIKLSMLSSQSLRKPNTVLPCSMASPSADEESVSLHKKTNQTMRKAAKKARPDMYQEVTNRIVNQLEKGVLPWRKTWSSYGLARNYVSGKTYKGINMLLMNFFSPHSIPYYLTFNQAKELGGKVKKGAKSLQVIYYNMIFKDGNGNKISREEADKMGKDATVMKFLKYYNVFNVDDVEGIDFTFEELQLLPNERIERCDKIVKGYPSPPSYVEKDKGRAYYHPTEDFVNMPPIEQHDSAAFYYTTFFHELVHSTGHANRLAREEVTNPIRFGSVPYSEEELVAELGASFLCHVAGIDNDALIENSASYIHGWLKKLKDDKQLIFKAAAAAQKAVDYITVS